MKVAEVIDGLATDPAVGDALMTLTQRFGHTAVRAKDTPGFIVNHAGRGYGTEALRIVGEGICDFIDVDRVMREAAGFRLRAVRADGPDRARCVASGDGGGLPAILRRAALPPSVITAQRLAGGRLGRKTKGGFYDYADGAQTLVEDPGADGVADVGLGQSWPARCLRRRHGPAREDERRRRSRIAPVARRADRRHAARRRTRRRPRSTTTSTRRAPWAIDTLMPLALRRTLMTTPVTRADVRAQAHALFASDGVPVTVIGDSPGFVAQRILATIVNIACDIAQQKIATPADIDLAVKLGLNYPNGPLALGDALGPLKILTILRSMQAFYGDPRYRPSPWLTRRRALLGVSLTMPEIR